MTTAILIAASLAFGCLNCHGIPDFCASPTVTSTGGELASDPAAIVVVPKGVTATVLKDQVVTVRNIGVHGELIVLGELRVVNGLTYEDGADMWADGSRLVIRDAAPTDPAQWGTGWITSGKTTYGGSCRAPAVRAVGNLAVGQTVIPVDDAADWRVGDEVVVPDVRQNVETVEVDQHERRKIVSIQEGEITLDRGLVSPHTRPLHANGNFFASIPLLNLTRGIKVTSENPAGARGHWAAVGRADVRLVGVEFDGLGRTEYLITGKQQQTKTTRNQIGRYAGPHLHHVYGPLSSHNGYQWEIRGCSVHDMNTGGWGFTIHQSHYGLMQDCVAWGGRPDATRVAAGIVTEDGPEYRNVLQNIWSGDSLSAFWLIGPEQTVRQCVAIDSIYGFEFGREGMASPKWKYPDQRGEEPATYAERPEKQFIPVDFSDNEAIGCYQVAVNWGHTREQLDAEDAPIKFVLGSMKGWNCRNGYNGYYDDRAVKLVGWRLHADPAISEKNTIGITFGGNSCARIEVEDSEIIGYPNGVHYRPRGKGSRMVLRRTKIWAKTCILGQPMHQSPAYGNVSLLLDGCDLQPRKTGEPSVAIDLSTIPDNKVSSLQENFVQVRNHSDGTNFDASWSCQSPTFVISAGHGSAIPAKIVGLTNQQAWDQHKLALFMAVAPTGTRPDVKGFVKPIVLTPVPKRVDVLLRDGLKPADLLPFEIKPVDAAKPIVVKVSEEP